MPHTGLSWIQKMARDGYTDLLAFIHVAREGGFTRAAARLGVSTSALSHSVRALETRDGERVSGVYRRSVMLASGRYAMLDDGKGFSLVPLNNRGPGP